MPDPPVNSLLMYTADEIDFQTLSPATLHALALEVDPFIATSALGELSSRDPALAEDAARALLRETDDRYLLSEAASILIGPDPDAVLGELPARLTSDSAQPLLEALADDDRWMSAPAAAAAMEALDGSGGEAGARVLAAFRRDPRA